MTAPFLFVALQLGWLCFVARRLRSGTVAGWETFAPYWLVRNAWNEILRPAWEHYHERKAFAPALGELLDHVQSSLSVGIPLRRTLEEAASLRGRSARMRENLLRLRTRLDVGEGVPVALRAEGERLLAVGGEERLLGLLFTNLALCERLGANTAQVVGSVRARLGERAALLRRLRADTAQVRFQGAVLCCAPSVFALGFAVLSPERFDFFLGSSIGVVTLGVVAALNVTGGLVTFRLSSSRSLR